MDAWNLYGALRCLTGRMLDCKTSRRRASNQCAHANVTKSSISCSKSCYTVHTCIRSISSIVLFFYCTPWSFRTSVCSCWLCGAFNQYWLHCPPCSEEPLHDRQKLLENNQTLHQETQTGGTLPTQVYLHDQNLNSFSLHMLVAYPASDFQLQMLKRILLEYGWEGPANRHLQNHSLVLADKRAIAQ